MEAQIADTSDREIKLSRLLNAPIALVWEVWTDPQHVSQWWGPTGFSNTITKMEVVPGGKWELMMHGPDGINYPNKSVFKEILTHRKIVYEHATWPWILATIEFESRGDKTFISWHMLFESKEELLKVIKEHNAREGLQQNLEKLDSYVRDRLQ